MAAPRRRQRAASAAPLLSWLAVALALLGLASLRPSTASPTPAPPAAAAHAARYAEWAGPPPPLARRQPRSRPPPQRRAPAAVAKQTRQTPHLSAAELPPTEVPAAIQQSATLTSCIYNQGIRIVTPVQPEFWHAAQSDNLNYHYLPLAVAYPNSTRAVSDVVRCAARHGKPPVSARSGGHSFSGSGSGGQDGALVVDLASLDFIELAPAQMHDAYVGPGARLGDVVKKLWHAGRRGMTHGTCPTVGVGGHALCGGFGPLSRAWGLAADAILSLDVILADGSFAVVNPVEHSDLLAGMRGAGNHFGIATRFTFRTQDVSNRNMTYLSYTWRDNIPTARHFAKLLDGITAWSSRKDLPAELGYHLQITQAASKEGKGAVQVHFRGNYLGPKNAAEMVMSTLWPELRSRGGDSLATPDRGSDLVEMNWLEMMSEWDDFGEPGDKLNTAKERLEHNNYLPKTTLIRTNPAAPAGFGPSVGAQVPLDVWEKWASVFYDGARQAVGAGKWSWNVFMELFGGYNAAHLAPRTRDASSVPFLDGMWLVQQTVGTWPGAHVDAQGKSWVRRMHDVLNHELDRAKIAKASYGCYQDPDRADWLEAFHGTGTARDRLFALKDRYDPNNLFRNAQSLGSKAERAAHKAGVASSAEVADDSWTHDIHPLPR